MKIDSKSKFGKMLIDAFLKGEKIKDPSGNWFYVTKIQCLPMEEKIEVEVERA